MRRLIGIPLRFSLTVDGGHQPASKSWPLHLNTWDLNPDVTSMTRSERDRNTRKLIRLPARSGSIYVK
ncbi:hypothetical protein DPX16_6589 [Anabarilius grahami]|uniref:Uncharacterized protein n=1 Tax=Anabarilius grahami TaxID=495550 RepID=A0A3N0XYI1_ANAGA|nr:hypothetical protein DPX16_6589 [Anabarilius grahami]